MVAHRAGCGDEIHAVARDKRGAHLALSLERLEALCDRHPVRIGLSATQRPIEMVGRLLVGTRPLPAVVDVGHRRDMDLALELPEGELEAVAVPAPQSDVDRHDLAEAVAEQLLNRWGVLFRNLALHDSLRLPWREIQWALRRLEDRGLVLGGRFVPGFSGEQYALPAAAEALGHARKLQRTQERVVVNATDPLNLVGVIVPGDTIAAVRTHHVTYVDGLPEVIQIAHAR